MAQQSSAPQLNEKEGRSDSKRKVPSFPLLFQSPRAPREKQNIEAGGLGEVHRATQLQCHDEGERRVGLGLRDNQLITSTPTLREGLLGFSREIGPIEWTYGCGQVSV